MAVSSENQDSRRGRKIAAIAAGLLVVGVGATYTLASWSDSEWVWGGADGDPGLGTSSFNVQQDASSPFASPGTWGDFAANPGDELTFSVGALQLAPGVTTYAPVALRTAADSVGGTVELQGATAATGITVIDTGDLLWSAVRVSVYTAVGATPPSTCDEDFTAAGWTQIVTDAPLTTVAGSTQTLAAAAGSTQHYCFAVGLPSTVTDTTLQGRTIAPAWEFAAESAAP